MSRCDLCGTETTVVAHRLGPVTLAVCAACEPRLPLPGGGACPPETAQALTAPPPPEPGTDLLGVLSQAAQSRERAQQRWEAAFLRAARHYGPSALAAAAGVSRPTIYSTLARLTKGEHDGH